MTEKEKAYVFMAHSKGITQRAIAAEIGVSQTTISRLLRPEVNERFRVMSREAKRRRTGTCIRCGATTHYSGKQGGAVSTRCQACAAIEVGLKARGNGPQQLRLKSLLKRYGMLRFSEMRDLLGKKNNDMGPLIDRALKQGWLERPQRGFYRLAS